MYLRCLVFYWIHSSQKLILKNEENYFSAFSSTGTIHQRKIRRKTHWLLWEHKPEIGYWYGYICVNFMWLNKWQLYDHQDFKI